MENEKKIIFESETILDDSFPVHWDYLYVVDGEVIRSDIKGTVLDLKMDLRNHLKLEAKEVRRCDIEERRKMLENEDKGV